MPCLVLDGKKVAREIEQQLAREVDQWKNDGHSAPCLAAILVGSDPASRVYVKNKERSCQRLGMESRLIELSESTTTSELFDVIDDLNRDGSINGILLQLPVPASIDSRLVLDRIDPLKDVDAFHAENVGRISQGRPRFLPCTPHGVIRLLAAYAIPCKGREIVVVGRSDIVGKPLVSMLIQKDGPCGPDYCNATATCCHSLSDHLSEITRRADVLIAAVGRPNLISAEMVKPGAVVIDVGINRLGEKLVGDVDFEACREVASAITPVPGGIGPLTVAMLMSNTLHAARVQFCTSA